MISRLNSGKTLARGGKRMKILVCGAGGFIGHHLVKKLVSEGHDVTGADLKKPLFEPSPAKDFRLASLRNWYEVRDLFREPYDEVYQLAADMGGAGYIFTGEHDAELMTNSVLVNLNVLQAVLFSSPRAKIMYSSSACAYPAHIQEEPNNPGLKETDAYPANPDSEYGWEKLFSERLYLAYARNYNLDVSIARFHNIYGPLGCYEGGREKAPAAICRKVALAQDSGEVEVWGDGAQTRSFLYIDDCIDGVQALMNSSCKEPVNIGSEEQVSIDGLTDLVIATSEKRLTKKHIPGPQGVRGRNSNNDLVTAKTGWKPRYTLSEGIYETYHWIKGQIEGKQA